MFISLLESAKAKFVFCSIKIQYYMSSLAKSCFDQFRLSLHSWFLIKVVLRSSFLEIHNSLTIFDYILICKMCTSVNTALLAKSSFFAHLRLKWSVFDILKTVSKFSESNTIGNLQLQKCSGTSILKF